MGQHGENGKKQMPEFCPSMVILPTGSQNAEELDHRLTAIDQTLGDIGRQVFLGDLPFLSFRNIFHYID